jgi:hypothetical protein
VSQDVYRAPKLPEPVEPPPSELVYVAMNREKQGIQYAWMQLFALPVLLGIGVAIGTGISWLGLVVTIGAGVFAYRFRKKALGGDGAILRIEQGELKVYTRSGVAPLAVVKLRELSDVRLDIKTIQRVQEGDSMVAAVRFTNTTVGPAIDQARIVLVGRKTSKTPDRLQVHLTDEYFAHMDSTEWLGKIRVFLRKNGWIPADERKKDKTAS